MSALRRAVRAGKNETVALLVRRGAPDDSTDIDRFIGACRRADRQSAEELLAQYPDLRDRLTDDDRAAIVEAAGSGSVAAVGLMLELGFSPDARNGFGEQPLHSAAYTGNAELVRLLIDAGADVDGRDARFDSTPLAFATVGSGERAGQHRRLDRGGPFCSSTPAPPGTACGSRASRPARRSPTFSAATASPQTTSPSPKQTTRTARHPHSVPG